MQPQPFINIRGNTFKPALLKDTPIPLRVFFYPACHLPALTGGVIFCGIPSPRAIVRITYPDYEIFFLLLHIMNPVSGTASDRHFNFIHDFCLLKNILNAA